MEQFRWNVIFCIGTCLSHANILQVDAFLGRDQYFASPIQSNVFRNINPHHERYFRAQRYPVENDVIVITPHNIQEAINNGNHNTEKPVGQNSTTSSVFVTSVKPITLFTFPALISTPKMKAISSFNVEDTKYRSTAENVHNTQLVNSPLFVANTEKVPISKIPSKKSHVESFNREPLLRSLSPRGDYTNNRNSESTSSSHSIPTQTVLQYVARLKSQKRNNSGDENKENHPIDHQHDSKKEYEDVDHRKEEFQENFDDKSTQHPYHQKKLHQDSNKQSSDSKYQLVQKENEQDSQSSRRYHKDGNIPPKKNNAVQDADIVSKNSSSKYSRNNALKRKNEILTTSSSHLEDTRKNGDGKNTYSDYDHTSEEVSQRNYPDLEKKVTKPTTSNRKHSINPSTTTSHESEELVTVTPGNTQKSKNNKAKYEDSKEDINVSTTDPNLPRAYYKQGKFLTQKDYDSLNDHSSEEDSIEAKKIFKASEGREDSQAYTSEPEVRKRDRKKIFYTSNDYEDTDDERSAPVRQNVDTYNRRPEPAYNRRPEPVNDNYPAVPIRHYNNRDSPSESGQVPYQQQSFLTTGPGSEEIPHLVTLDRERNVPRPELVPAEIYVAEEKPYQSQRGLQQTAVELHPLPIISVFPPVANPHRTRVYTTDRSGSQNQHKTYEEPSKNSYDEIGTVQYPQKEQPYSAEVITATEDFDPHYASDDGQSGNRNEKANASVNQPSDDVATHQPYGAKKGPYRSSEEIQPYSSQSDERRPYNSPEGDRKYRPSEKEEFYNAEKPESHYSSEELDYIPERQQEQRPYHPPQNVKEKPYEKPHPSSNVENRPYPPPVVERAPYPPQEVERRPAYNPHEEERRPIYTSQHDERRPVYTPQHEERRPVYTPQHGERRPAYIPHKEEKRPAYISQEEEKRPAYIQHEEETGPAYTSQEREPAYIPQEEERRPSYNPQQEERRPAYNPQQEYGRPAYTPQQEEKRPYISKHNSRKTLSPSIHQQQHPQQQKQTHYPVYEEDRGQHQSQNSDGRYYVPQEEVKNYYPTRKGDQKPYIQDTSYEERPQNTYNGNSPVHTNGQHKSPVLFANSPSKSHDQGTVSPSYNQGSSYPADSDPRYYEQPPPPQRNSHGNEYHTGKVNSEYPPIQYQAEPRLPSPNSRSNTKVIFETVHPGTHYQYHLQPQAELRPNLVSNIFPIEKSPVNHISFFPSSRVHFSLSPSSKVHQTIKAPSGMLTSESIQNPVQISVARISDPTYIKRRISKIQEEDLSFQDFKDYHLGNEEFGSKLDQTNSTQTVGNKKTGTSIDENELQKAFEKIKLRNSNPLNNARNEDILYKTVQRRGYKSKQPVRIVQNAKSEPRKIKYSRLKNRNDITASKEDDVSTTTETPPETESTTDDTTREDEEEPETTTPPPEQTTEAPQEEEEEEEEPEIIPQERVPQETEEDPQNEANNSDERRPARSDEEESDPPRHEQNRPSHRSRPYKRRQYKEDGRGDEVPPGPYYNVGPQIPPRNNIDRERRKDTRNTHRSQPYQDDLNEDPRQPPNEPYSSFNRQQQPFNRPYRSSDRPYENRDRNYQNSNGLFQNSDRSFENNNRPYQGNDRLFENGRSNQYNNKPYENQNRRYQYNNAPYENSNRPLQNINKPYENSDRRSENTNRPYENSHRQLQNSNRPYESLNGRRESFSTPYQPPNRPHQSSERPRQFSDRPYKPVNRQYQSQPQYNNGNQRRNEHDRRPQDTHNEDDRHDNRPQDEEREDNRPHDEEREDKRPHDEENEDNRPRDEEREDNPPREEEPEENQSTEDEEPENNRRDNEHENDRRNDDDNDRRNIRPNSERQSNEEPDEDERSIGRPYEDEERNKNQPDYDDDRNTDVPDFEKDYNNNRQRPQNGRQGPSHGQNYQEDPNNQDSNPDDYDPDRNNERDKVNTNEPEENSSDSPENTNEEPEQENEPENNREENPPQNESEEVQFVPVRASDSEAKKEPPPFEEEEDEEGSASYQPGRGNKGKEYNPHLEEPVYIPEEFKNGENGPGGEAEETEASQKNVKSKNTEPEEKEEEEEKKDEKEDEKEAEEKESPSSDFEDVDIDDYAKNVDDELETIIPGQKKRFNDNTFFKIKDELENTPHPDKYEPSIPDSR